VRTEKTGFYIRPVRTEDKDKGGIMEDMSYEDLEDPPGTKPPHANPRPQVWAGVTEEDWNDWHWQVRNRITKLDELKQVINLTAEEEQGVVGAREAFRMAITPYFVSLMDPHDPGCPIRRQVVPTVSELHVDEVDREDPLGEEEDSPVPGLVHRYPDRVLMVVTDQCPTYCRFCTRRRLVSRGRESVSLQKIDGMIEYVREHSEVRDALISGGDGLFVAQPVLEHLLRGLRSIPHLEVIRIGTRVPVNLPQRITSSLVEMLRRYHPLWINIHVNHPQEITPEMARACAMLADAGIPLGSQTVLLAGINDCPNVIRQLVQDLVKIRVRPYYLYQCDLSEGIGHFRTPVSKGIEIIEHLRGHTSGFAIPTFVIDAPGGGGKVPVMPQYLMSQSDSRVVVRNYEGQMFSYPEPRRYEAHDPAQCRFCADRLGVPKVGVAARLTPSEAPVLAPEPGAQVWPILAEQGLAVGAEPARRKR
jgi:lysine 2,3-aminomutase